MLARVRIHYLVLLLLFLVLPIFDSINGVLVINGLIEEGGIASPSQLGRAILMALLIFVVYRTKLSIVPFFFLFFLLLVEFLYGFFHGEPYGVLLGIITAQKLIYLLLLAIVLKSILDKGLLAQEDFFKLFQINLLILSLCLVFSTVTGLGNSTYGWGFGTKSFFSSGNGLGLYLGIGTTILIGIRNYFYSDINFKILLVCSFSVALIGTKTALIFCIVNLTILLWTSKFRWLIFFGLSAVMPFLMDEVISIVSVMFEVITTRLSKSDNIMYYLGSGRIEYVTSAFEVFWKGDGSAFRLLFGSGALISFHSTTQPAFFDVLETDLFDLIFMYGLVSACIYLGLSVFICYKLRKHTILFVASLLLLGHSVVAGHVIFNGMSSVCFAIFYALSSNVTRLYRC
ncbi:O-antigen ligase family protein [Vibrio coralliilyticus]|uniref:O-antigen ligase family protein n=1 Tax=Vibrio coralliilyticus TaxID=190893 RepID=UPI0015604505|nr:O-antigen ligase family protein [Vibrio coralliilyticus]NRF27189.1 O-antigen ligase family protein [Vibrio coralliilyticus]NRF81459.1 O-antigen ligase family protein [Vibrio coralliilyticus]